MNFDFSDDQKLLRDQARRFLARECPTALVRAAYDEGAPNETLWRAIAGMGWLGTSIPEAHGGLGLGHLELCVLAEELGRALAPVPFSSTAYLFAEALMAAGSEAQKQRFLPAIAAGRIVGTFARSERPGALTARSIALRFDGTRIHGLKTPVSDGMQADAAVVLARGPAEGADALSLVLVDLHGAGVTRRTLRALDPSRGLASISFDGAPAEPLGAIGEGWRLTQCILDRAAVMIAFEQLGGADACLAMARDYALQRHSFGKVIGAHQAIKHKLADVYVSNEIARSNAWFAAWALANDSSKLPLAAAAARIAATQAFDLAAKENIQTHGGIGFTWAADPHLYYKRSRALGLVLGAQRGWKERLVAGLERQGAA